MRQIALSDKKLRGIPRRIRALEKWAQGFSGYGRPQSEALERYFNWKIPVHSALVQGRQTNLGIQSRCVAALLKAASCLTEASSTASNGYYRVACLITWPWLHQSEVTIFYDKSYYESFLGKTNALAPRRISEKLSLSVPARFLEHGHDITQPEDTFPVESWCIGEEA
ncbi:DUF3916 domain-containing protein [Denitromonas iodatirespirans]|uniref:DUF3916 domain-containing protein n=1 Tax=Denitromonas iodatirespirans TaxID=2795389 RepID=A0A944DNK8_DENI1|nr:DUF3916 domain-containing protein [Denitromonas iodatirespirans]MBT0961894.1 DUF3916 domain-containing protein [Denitromonas iodatirespirans]